MKLEASHLSLSNEITEWKQFSEVIVTLTFGLLFQKQFWSLLNKGKHLGKFEGYWSNDTQFIEW